jgi:rhodanese-related sulfurtransferase
VARNAERAAEEAVELVADEAAGALDPVDPVEVAAGDLPDGAELLPQGDVLPPVGEDGEGPHDEE